MFATYVTWKGNDMEFPVEVERLLPAGLPSTVLAEFVQGVREFAPGATLLAGSAVGCVRVVSPVGPRYGWVEVHLAWVARMVEVGASWWEMGREVGVALDARGCHRVAWSDYAGSR